MAELDYEYLDRLLKKAKEDDSDALAELYAATYYGSIYILKNAIERAGTTESDALLKALNETDNLQGVVGKYKPNSMREMVHEGIICKLEDGTAVYLDSITVED